MLVGVAPAASASLISRPGFQNDASHNAAAHGLLPVKRRLFLSRSSSADLTMDAGR